MPESFIAEVVIDHPDLPLTPTIRSVDEMEVRVESQPFTALDSPSIFYSVSGGDFGSFEAALENDQTVEKWRQVNSFSDIRIYQVFPSSEAKFTIPKVYDLGLQVLTIRRHYDSWYFQIQIPEREKLGAYWQYCRDEDVEFDLKKLYTSGPRTSQGESGLRAELTARQREVGRTVSRMEYFDSEGANSSEVAEELGISQSTLSTHLRRIMERVFDSLFGE